jgi:hypothetical protein
MTAPNKPTQADILAAREIMKSQLTPAFRNAVDAGELDGYGLFNRAMEQLIREREAGDTEE